MICLAIGGILLKYMVFFVEYIAYLFLNSTHKFLSLRQGKHILVICQGVLHFCPIKGYFFNQYYLLSQSIQSRSIHSHTSFTQSSTPFALIKDSIKSNVYSRVAWTFCGIHAKLMQKKNMAAKMAADGAACSPIIQKRTS